MSRKKRGSAEPSQGEQRPAESAEGQGGEGSPSAGVSARAGALVRDVSRWSRERAVTLSGGVRAGTAMVQLRGGDLVRRTGQLAKDHPVATGAVVVGAVALANAKVAAGAAIGIGVTVLVARQTSPETRARIDAWLSQGRSRLAQGLARLANLVEPTRS